MSDFRYFRGPGQRLTDWHFDGGECENWLLPANFTARARLRAWVTLDDDAPGPELIPQSGLRPFLGDKWQAYLSGELGRGPADLQLLTNPEFWRPFKEALKDGRTYPRARLGDVLLHSPCLMHRSPVSSGERSLGFLCPTYQPAGSRIYQFPMGARRQCKSGLPEGLPAAWSHCFPRASPAPEHLRGREVEFAFEDSGVDASRWHWLLGYTGRRWHDLKTWEPPQDGGGGPGRWPGAARLAQFANGLAESVVQLPGIYVV